MILLTKTPLACCLLFLLALTASAAELIQTPSGVVVRSIFSWETADSLEVSAKIPLPPVTITEKGADFFFQNSVLCENANYRIKKSDSLTNEPWINLQNFCAATHEDSTKFAVIADTQEFDDVHQQGAELLHKLIEQDSEIKFVVNLGDLVEWGGKREDWIQYRMIASTYYSNTTPVVPVVGNHDYYGDSHLRNFDELYRTPETASHHYLIDFGAFAFIVLDSSVYKLGIKGKRTQTEWLNKTLAQIGGHKPIVLAYHHPAYSSGPSTLTMPRAPHYIRKHWLPLFKKYGVKLILNGHEHIYERLLIDNLHCLVTGSLAGTPAHPLHTPSEYSQVLLPGHHTITIIEVTKTGRVHLLTRDSLTA